MDDTDGFALLPPEDDGDEYEAPDADILTDDEPAPYQPNDQE